MERSVEKLKNATKFSKVTHTFEKNKNIPLLRMRILSRVLNVTN